MAKRKQRNSWIMTAIVPRLTVIKTYKTKTMSVGILVQTNKTKVLEHIVSVVVRVLVDFILFWTAATQLAMEGIRKCTLLISADLTRIPPSTAGDAYAQGP